MDSPEYLFDQYVKKCGLSAAMAKRALLLKVHADNGRTLAASAEAIGISPSSARRIARNLIIDFADYRPFARLERKGEARPMPYSRNIAFRADDLPLFST